MLGEGQKEVEDRCRQAAVNWAVLFSVAAFPVAVRKPASSRCISCLG